MWKQESATMQKTPAQKPTRTMMQFGLEITLEKNQTQYLQLNFITQKTTLIQTLLFIMKKMKKQQKSVKNF